MNVNTLETTTSILRALASLEDQKDVRDASEIKADVITIDGDASGAAGGYIYILYTSNSSTASSLKGLTTGKSDELVQALNDINQKQLAQFYGSQSGGGDLSSISSIAELNYGKKRIATLLIPPGGDSHLVRVPYNGGDLKDGDFSVTEYNNEGSSGNNTVLVIICKPVLSSLEKSILQQVPAGSSGIHMSYDGGDPVFPGVAATVVAAAIIYGAYTFVSNAAGMLTASRFDADKTQTPQIQEELLKSLKPKMAAKELLKLRSQFLLK